MAIATGVVPRPAAALLGLSLIPTTLAGHRFWERDDRSERADQTFHFLKNVGILGGLLFAATSTGGRPSVPWRAQPRRPPRRQRGRRTGRRHRPNGLTRLGGQGRIAQPVSALAATASLPAPRGCSSTVEPQPSKLVVRVRFPSPAPRMPWSAGIQAGLLPGGVQPCLRVPLSCHYLGARFYPSVRGGVTRNRVSPCAAPRGCGSRARPRVRELLTTPKRVDACSASTIASWPAHVLDALSIDGVSEDDATGSLPRSVRGHSRRGYRTALCEASEIGACGRGRFRTLVSKSIPVRCTSRFTRRPNMTTATSTRSRRQGDNHRNPAGRRRPRTANWESSNLQLTLSRCVQPCPPPRTGVCIAVSERARRSSGVSGDRRLFVVVDDEPVLEVRRLDCRRETERTSTDPVRMDVDPSLTRYRKDVRPRSIHITIRRIEDLVDGCALPQDVDSVRRARPAAD